MLRAIILDCGGVMCYPRRGNWLIPTNLEEILSSPIPSFDEKAFFKAHEKCGHFLDEGQLILTSEQEIGLRKAYTCEIARLLGYPLTDAQALAIAESLSLDETRHQFYDDSRKWMHLWAQKVKVGMLSDSMPALLRTMKLTGADRDLSSMVISCFHGFKKPDERMYRTSLDELGVLPEEAVFVDDLENNLIAAEKIGIPAVRMCRPFYTNAAPKPFSQWSGPRVSNFSELDALLFGENPPIDNPRKSAFFRSDGETGREG